MFLNDDDMVECPYNKTHRMLRKRLQTHLHKCRLNYPDVELRKCPFNITHLIPEPEFAHHATNCPDRKLITQYKYDAPEPKEEEVPKHAPIECDEDWDDTNVNDYNPQKYLENAQIIRKPDGLNASERKKFIKKERKRLGDGDISSGDESNNEEFDSERSYRSKSYSSNHSKCSRSPETLSYARQRSRSPYNKSGRDHSRSRSPSNYGKTYRNHSPRSRRRSPNYTRSNSPPSSSSYAYNSDQDPYYNGGRYNDPNNFSNNYDSNYSHINESQDATMPEPPPPPMISYPAPRSYNNTKYPHSKFRY